MFSVDHVRRRVTDLLERYAGPFDTDPERIGRQFGGLDLSAGPDALVGLQDTLGDPEVLLGAVRSPEQEAIQPELTAIIAAITGYVDWAMDSIGETLIGSYSMITEALRRRRVEAAAGDRFVERILGLQQFRAAVLRFQHAHLPSLQNVIEVLVGTALDVCAGTLSLGSGLPGSQQVS